MGPICRRATLPPTIGWPQPSHRVLHCCLPLIYRAVTKWSLRSGEPHCPCEKERDGPGRKITDTQWQKNVVFITRRVSQIPLHATWSFITQSLHAAWVVCRKSQTTHFAVIKLNVTPHLWQRLSILAPQCWNTNKPTRMTDLSSTHWIICFPRNPIIIYTRGSISQVKLITWSILCRQYWETLGCTVNKPII